jgi:protein-tyrosine phosphatase
MPHPNCYWVVPGELMAGEYPGAVNAAAAREKIISLLDGGITSFVDLTESHELAPYDRLLEDEAGRRGALVSYQRICIQDVSVPQSPAVMHKILNAIDASIARGEVVYVHCWGGIGRTGTVVGCYLVRHGMTGEQALEEVLKLYRATMEKRHRRPYTPETPAQCEWVRNWKAGS